MPADPPTRLAADHLHGFLRSLELAGVPVSPPKQADFLLSLVASPPADLNALYWRARLTTVTGPEAFEAFDHVFDAWFRGGRLVLEADAAPPADERGETAAPPAGREGELDALDVHEGSGREASAVEGRGARGFAPTSARGREELRECAAALATALPAISARRSVRARRGRRLDLDRVMRAANRTGGEVVRLAWRRRPSRPRRVLVLIDVSGSLRQHSPDLLRFGHQVVRSAERAEVFTFGTRLTRVTRELGARDVDAALAALTGRVLDADGGTRIGVALQQFLDNSRYVALARGALVIVLSDGLERGDPAAMAEATRRLSRLGHRLVWWSPLACDPAYRPVTRGMRAILGNLDALAGARDLPTIVDEVRRLPETAARPRRTVIRTWSAT